MLTLYVLLIIAMVLLIPTAYAGLIGAPYAPTRMPVVKKALEVIGLNKDDLLVDLGAGDGQILLAAHHRGAKAWGYELSPIMWAVAWGRAGWKKGITVSFGNFYNRPVKDATVVFVFLMPDKMAKVQKYLAAQHSSKSRLVLAYMFPFKELVPVQVVRADKCGPIYVYEWSQMEEGSS